jgi:FAD/FMN-containing dehydrogenase
MATDASTLTGAKVSISDSDLEELRAQIRGAVLTPADAGFGDIREAFNAMHGSKPDLIVSCTGTADVVDAVNFAREHGMVLAIRGGGHSIAGLSAIEGGMLLDLSPMNGVIVDPDLGVAHAQGGALWGDVDRETQAFGLVAPGGVVSDTGIAGLTLGGGYGWVRRKYGLSSDSLLEVQIVCADGEVRTASEDENPDLFWAIRGGGGNFGVVTSFRFKLHPRGPSVAFVGAVYPVEEVADVLRGWREYVTKAPDEVTSVCVTITFPADPAFPEVVHDRAVAVIGGVYVGDPDEGMRVMQPLRELGTLLMDMSQPMPFTAVQTSFDPFFPRNTLQAYWKSQYLEDLPDEAIDVIAARAQNRPAPLTLVNTFHMGGAIGNVDPEDTAFSERQWPFMISIDGMWGDPADNEANVAWVRSAWNEVKQFGTGGVYLNFTGIADEDLTAGVDTAFGRNLQRLAEVKAEYDPENFFRVNNNILPAK